MIPNCNHDWYGSNNNPNMYIIHTTQLNEGVESTYNFFCSFNFLLLTVDFVLSYFFANFEG